MYCYSMKFCCAALVLTLLVFSLGTADAFISSCYEEGYPKNLVLAVQEKLREKGFDPGPIDGKWGGKTRKAVARFQTHVGVPNADMLQGVLNGETLRALFGEWFKAEDYGLAPNKNIPYDVFDEYCK